MYVSNDGSRWFIFMIDDRHVIYVEQYCFWIMMIHVFFI